MRGIDDPFYQSYVKMFNNIISEMSMAPERLHAIGSGYYNDIFYEISNYLELENTEKEGAKHQGGGIRRPSALPVPETSYEEGLTPKLAEWLKSTVGLNNNRRIVFKSGTKINIIHLIREYLYTVIEAFNLDKSTVTGSVIKGILSNIIKSILFRHPTIVVQAAYAINELLSLDISSTGGAPRWMASDQIDEAFFDIMRSVASMLNTQILQLDGVTLKETANADGIMRTLSPVGSEPDEPGVEGAAAAAPAEAAAAPAEAAATKAKEEAEMSAAAAITALIDDARTADVTFERIKSILENANIANKKVKEGADPVGIHRITAISLYTEALNLMVKTLTTNISALTSEVLREKITGVQKLLKTLESMPAKGSVEVSQALRAGKVSNLINMYNEAADGDGDV
jgi:hypothetical protein